MNLMPPEGTVFPNSVFFDPYKKFIKWLHKYARGRLIVDAGAGIGRVGAMLLEQHERQILSLDFIEREMPESLVLRKDAVSFEYTRGMLVMIARPCRGQWIEDTIWNAGEKGAEILYIGKEEHVENDTVWEYMARTLVYKNAGKDREVVYSLKQECLINEDKEHWVLVKTKDFDDPWWVEMLDEERWGNHMGGYCYRDPDNETILEECWVESYVELDHTKTGMVLKPKQSTGGWIDPQGNFYGCLYMGHNDIISLIIKRTTNEVMDEGWIKIYNMPDQKINRSIDLYYCCEKTITPEQKKTMLELGYKKKQFSEWDWEDVTATV